MCRARHVPAPSRSVCVPRWCARSKDACAPSTRAAAFHHRRNQVRTTLDHQPRPLLLAVGLGGDSHQPHGLRARQSGRCGPRRGGDERDAPAARVAPALPDVVRRRRGAGGEHPTAGRCRRPRAAGPKCTTPRARATARRPSSRRARRARCASATKRCTRVMWQPSRAASGRGRQDPEETGRTQTLHPRRAGSTRSVVSTS